MTLSILKASLASVAACAVVSCTSAPGSDEDVVNNLERCASFMREVESDKWPSADVIEEGTEKLKLVYSGKVKGSIHLGFDPEFALHNCAKLFTEHGRNKEANEMEAAARYYKKRNVEAFNKQRMLLQ